MKWSNPMPLPLTPIEVAPGPATQLRDAWLSRRPVALLLEGCQVSLVVGRVSSVSITGAFATVDGWHIPLDRVTDVELPPSRIAVEAYAHAMHQLREQANERGNLT